jgi:adenylosuccinate lyase
MSTLTDDEMARVKAELDDNVVSYGAQPYIDVRAVYDVIRDYVVSSSVAPTTSATAVTSAGPTTITLASATGYSAGQRIVLDADDARETVTIRSLTGAVASVVAKKTHGGTYPVEVESPVTIVRGLLSDLIMLDEQSRAQVNSALGLKQVDEVQWATENGGIAAAFAAQRRALRLRLAAACGLSTLYAVNRGRSGGGSSYEAY